MNTLPKVEIFTDGACSGNPGPGGWGAVLQYGDTVKQLKGGAQLTTNNQMELTAIIKSLEIVPEKSRVTVFTDSQYVCAGITRHIKSWKANGWKNSQKQPVKNKELWQALDKLVLEMECVEFTWIKGHSNSEMNERVDKLAKKCLKEFMEEANAPETSEQKGSPVVATPLLCSRCSCKL